ncbi:MAG: pyrroline-5-carboxylate reductase [Rhodospirillaceae bacterium]|nr:pyrroline-5-carboxylate reductase [Rhodospirillaceae bacterium]|tara:strand:- start:9521 stop:10342 length:822 start_codon:yes stop_codon:yes gene_type:complete
MSKLSSSTILLVGGGRMGSALLSGWISSGIQTEQIILVEPDTKSALVHSSNGINVVSSPADLPNGYNPDALVLAIKPQYVSPVISSYKKYLNQTIIISVAAGITIKKIQNAVGHLPIVRAMPNTPAAIGKGITVACVNSKVNGIQKSLSYKLLEVTGKMVWIENELYMDGVTAVSGSGPAYVFLLIECLCEAGIAIGLPPKLSSQLAEMTVAGAGELAILAEESPTNLRQNVTSPGGTTAAALDILNGPNGMPDLLIRAVAAAAKRSKELSEE